MEYYREFSYSEIEILIKLYLKLTKNRSYFIKEMCTITDIRMQNPQFWKVLSILKAENVITIGDSYGKTVRYKIIDKKQLGEMIKKQNKLDLLNKYYDEFHAIIL